MVKTVCKRLGIIFLALGITTVSFAEDEEVAASTSYPVRVLNRPWTMQKQILETNLLFDAGNFTTATGAGGAGATMTYGITNRVEYKFATALAPVTTPAGTGLVFRFSSEFGVALFTLPHIAMRIGNNIPFNVGSPKVIQDTSINLLTWVGIIDNTVGFLFFDKKLLNFRFANGFQFDSEIPLTLAVNASDNIYLSLSTFLLKYHTDEDLEYIGKATPLTFTINGACNKYFDMYASFYTNANNFANTWGFSGGFALRLGAV